MKLFGVGEGFKAYFSNGSGYLVWKVIFSTSGHPGFKVSTEVLNGSHSRPLIKSAWCVFAVELHECLVRLDIGWVNCLRM